MRAPGVFFPLLSLVLFLRCQYQECDFLSEIVNLRRRLCAGRPDNEASEPNLSDIGAPLKGFLLKNAYHFLQ